MTTKRKWLWCAVLLLGGCNERQLDGDCDGMCMPAGAAFPGVGECQAGVCTPTYGECVTKSEFTTCAQACEAQGSTCVSNGCGGYTYRIYLELEWCEDPERTGGTISRECDEPIDYQVNEAVKCCCEQE